MTKTNKHLLGVSYIKLPRRNSKEDEEEEDDDDDDEADVVALETRGDGTIDIDLVRGWQNAAAEGAKHVALEG